MSQTHPLLPRDTEAPDPSSSKTWAISVAAVAAILVAIGITGIVAFRLKKRQFERHRRLNSTTSSDDNEAGPPTRRASQADSNSNNNRNSTFNANRLSVRSIRSIISLPPYRETPRETEEIIARAGDREGLDYIVEGPETAEEIEAHRREEMAAIFRVQQTRRRELDERTERRRARREALEQQDYREVARLDRAAAEARQRNRNGSTANLALGNVAEGHEPSSSELITELQEIRSRQRRVSEVGYAGLGTARHDGSRLRAQSVESDMHPLLESSAPMDGRVSVDSRNRSRASSVVSTSRPVTRNRERSRSRASRNGGDDEDATAPGRGSGETDVPPDPPSYEDDLSVHAGDVPPYEDSNANRSPHHSDGTPTSPEEAGAHTPPSSSEIHPQPEITEASPTSPLGHGLHNQEEEGRRTGATRPTLTVPSNLQTRNIMTPPPAIEVVSATPVHSAPNTPTSSRFNIPHE